ncbi:hypothetical protein FN846DRAFT_547878 [Sphaerosporella brunnea]|uniref:Protein kinase domain-containing protein n=1 Tax=Sphaerosporella brunnea TaxID=1250544 RepID=A0A5J5F2W6_9PEZI|nr:hypothetical protein FN846DRAFT_547878 [Sphaerosporella brunnea]
MNPRGCFSSRETQNKAPADEQNSTSDERAQHHRYNLRKRARICYAESSRRKQPPRTASDRSGSPSAAPQRKPCRPVIDRSCSSSPVFLPTADVPRGGMPPTPPLSPPAPINLPPMTPPLSPPAMITDTLPLITPLNDDARPSPYAALRLLRNFTCTFVREIQSTPAASVLLVSLPDSTRRILKLFPPPAPGYRDLCAEEAAAYAALRHHDVSNVPRCHGVVDRTIQVRGWCAGWHGRGLLLDYIPDAATVMAAPERLVRKPALVTDLVKALGRIHAAGVLHGDALPRNMLIDQHDRVWWVDFGSAATTATHHVDKRYFESEQWAVWDLLANDVVPAAREGRTPEWWIIGG